MSRDTNSICRTCGVYEPGDGLNATLIDCYSTVEEFDAELMRRFNMKPEDLPEEHTNAHIRAFLVRHAGHEIEYWSTDWIYHDDNVLEGLRLENPWLCVECQWSSPAGSGFWNSFSPHACRRCGESTTWKGGPA